MKYFKWKFSTMFYGLGGFKTSPFHTCTHTSTKEAKTESFNQRLTVVPWHLL